MPKDADIYHNCVVKIEQKLREVFKGLFFEGKMKQIESKINTHQVYLHLIAKMRSENLQGHFLTKKLHKGARNEIYERDIEILESLFSKAKLYAHSNVCCFMIVLQQRSIYGVENIGYKYIKKVLENYREASKRQQRAEFKKFEPLFKSVLQEAGKISLCCYINVKMQYFSSIYHQHHGEPELACKAIVQYLNSRIKNHMFCFKEEVVVEMIVAALYATEILYLRQAQHILNGALMMTDQLTEDQYQQRFQRTVLREFTDLAGAAVVARTLQLMNRYRRPELSATDRLALFPHGTYYKLALEMPTEVIEIAVPNASDATRLQLIEKLKEFGKQLDEPIVAALKEIYAAIYDLATA